MKYKNTEIKLNSLIGYFNDGKINLIPPFQRGHVWKLPQRKGLIRNVVAGRPVPAIFLYKEPDGSRYSYNILDGKQRLESLLLFIGNKRADVKIPQVAKYFFDKEVRKTANFSIDIMGSAKTFASLPDDVVRDFQEYAIPAVEISLDDESSLDEIIDLFIDINQQGEKVKRFDIVKAIGKNPLLEEVFDLIALKQKRKEDIYYGKKNSSFTRVLERLQIMQNLPSPNSVIDRMWERLLEIVLFLRTKKHRAPVQILKSFIRQKFETPEKAKLTKEELSQLRGCFKFLSDAYASNVDLRRSRFATDQTHFYTLVTTLLDSNLLAVKNKVPPDVKNLQAKLVAFAKIIDGKSKAPKRLAPKFQEYQTASSKQTTHIGQREIRQRLFLEILGDL